jgi:nucleotide-binding universal stress UspA family protein
MKALLAVDGSRETKKMLAYLATHTELLAKTVKLVVLNVQARVPPRAMRLVVPDVVDAYYRDNAESVLAPVSTFLTHHDADYTTEYRLGVEEEEIVNAAKKHKVDVIVMGSRGQGRIAALLLGSVTQKVLSLSPVPVMVIR